MPGATSRLYEPLIARDLEAIPAAVRAFREEHSSEELFQAVARFGALAFSPSQHGKHAFVSCLAAWDLREELGPAFDPVLIECAVYVAESRQPWSEPPLLDPPKVDPAHPVSLDEIDEALRQRDRARAEQWLAALLRHPQPERDFFRAAARDLSDFGHNLILAVNAWKLSLLQDSHPSYPALRVAVREWCAHQGPAGSQPAADMDEPSLLTELLRRVEQAEGSTVAYHDIALFDAARQAAELSGDVELKRGVYDALAAPVEPAAGASSSTASLPAPAGPAAYRLSRDLGQTLGSYAIRGRLKKDFPSAGLDRLVAWSEYNLARGVSFDEWNFG